MGTTGPGGVMMKWMSTPSTGSRCFTAGSSFKLLNPSQRKTHSSRQALLDYSLTQLYRVAERHHC